MISDSSFCCLPVDIAVRLIGTISLLTNALVFVALVSDSNDILTNDKVRIIFGFDSQFFAFDNKSEKEIELYKTTGLQIIGNESNCFLGNLQSYNNRKLLLPFRKNFFIRLHEFSILFAEWFPVFCLVLTLTAAIASALLIWASIIVQRWLTIPWLLCYSISIICHFSSLIMLSFTQLSSTEKWVTGFTVLYTVILLYFILVVISANYQWWIQSKKPLSYSLNQEIWENIYRSPPLFESAFKNQI